LDLQAPADHSEGATDDHGRPLGVVGSGGEGASPARHNNRTLYRVEENGVITIVMAWRLAEKSYRTADGVQHKYSTHGVHHTFRDYDAAVACVAQMACTAIAGVLPTLATRSESDFPIAVLRRTHALLQRIAERHIRYAAEESAP
jgi:hypothetical protein